ncbi:hypothetical protein LT330_003713 [Penicillium expansum]|nr:hypothetical protein LT330_003713 [Penicillium expansum]
MKPFEYPLQGTDPPETTALNDLVLVPPKPASAGCKRALAGPSPNLNAPLESLPPDIRRHLLSMLELETLKSLVHASPVFYQQYPVDQKWVLCRSLAAAFRSNSLIYEVRTVYECDLKAFWETRTKDTVTQSVQVYGDGRSASHNSPFSESVTLNRELMLDEAIRITKFYFSIIQPFTRKYTSSALENLASALRIPYNQHSDRLNVTEEIRLMRALYRFQLCCNIFSHGYNGSIFKHAPDYEGWDVSELLQSLFDP